MRVSVDLGQVAPAYLRGTGAADGKFFRLPMPGGATEGLWFGYSGDTKPATSASNDTQVTIAAGDAVADIQDALQAALDGLADWSCAAPSKLVVDQGNGGKLSVVVANNTATRTDRDRHDMFTARVHTNVVATANGDDRYTFAEVGAHDVAAFYLAVPTFTLDEATSTYRVKAGAATAAGSAATIFCCDLIW